MDNGEVGFKGFEGPHSEDEVIPCLQSWIKAGIESLEKRKGEMVSVDEVIKFLMNTLEMTEPELGFFFCPAASPMTKEILTKYGKKL